MDEVNSDLEDDINNLINNSDTEFGLKKSLENQLDSDDEPLNLLVPETKNPTIEKTFEEGSSKAEKDVKGKSNEKDKGKEKGKGKGKKKSENKIKKKKKRNQTWCN